MKTIENKKKTTKKEVKNPLSFIDELKTFTVKQTEKFPDIIFPDGSKLYSTSNYGQILIEDKKLIKLIDSYLYTLNDQIYDQLYDQLENENQETIIKVLRIIN